ncbi:twin-arginine translocase TatA/TatE family subunit [Pelagicoccus sp. SDUM812003]|uniref:Sec-independent protein translocase subunit TatA/TatB n=1 Tax=Pelagicoccus sp. SDUM812003 TaxID=3041267 RepID=UPI00280EA946|nr:twin-arginine translocase TatA/TatE family subunit [Pelagicoccus sp. SDUM812003]MDQ8203295.1 twin-arginine translocase TatA/TatE family subunit [Pelagicoccus sp. SDUM812003]
MHTSNAVLAIMNMGWPEITIVIVIFILLFGAKKLPELARGVGKSIKEFKKATSNLEDEVRSAIDEDNSKPSTPPAQPKKENASQVENK